MILTIPNSILLQPFSRIQPVSVVFGMDVPSFNIVYKEKSFS
jgi:hypothetical protein